MRANQIRFIRFLIIVMLLPFSSVLTACDLCGSFIGVLPYDNQSSISIQHRYRIFNGISGNAGTVFPSGAYRLPSNGHSVLHGTGHSSSALQADDYESFKTVELRGKWFIHPRCEISIIIPFSDNKSSYSGIKERATGLGDISLLAAWHLIRKMPEDKIRHRLVAGIGIKLPSGNFDQRSADGERIPLMMQNGTGSTDGIVYLAYTGGAFNFRWGISASGKYSGENKFREQVCPSESATLFLGYVLNAGKWKFIPQLQFYQEYLNGIYSNIALDQSSGMNAMLAGPALSVFRKNLSFDLGMQMPLYEQTDESNPAGKARLFAALTWSFNQTNYLINEKNN